MPEKFQSTLHGTRLPQDASDKLSILKKFCISILFPDTEKTKQKFIRKQKFTPYMLFLHVMNCIKGPYQNNPDHYYRALFRLNLPIRFKFATRINLPLARIALKYKTFIEYHHHLPAFFGGRFQNIRAWTRFRRRTMNASTLMKLFKDKEIPGHFCVLKSKEAPACVTASVPQCPIY